MMGRACGLLVVLVTLPGVVMAADESGAFAVKGVGLSTCKQFVTAVQEKDKERMASYVGWVGGFITGNNQNMEQTFDLTPWQNLRTVSAALFAFCDTNADMRFAEAAARMTAAMRKDRVVSRSDLVPIEHDGQTQYVYREALRRAQSALAERGIFTGDVSGEFDDATRSALKAFQEEAKLPVSGLPDQRTLFMLFRPAAS